MKSPPTQYPRRGSVNTLSMRTTRALYNRDARVQKVAKSFCARRRWVLHFPRVHLFYWSPASSVGAQVSPWKLLRNIMHGCCFNAWKFIIFTVQQVCLYIADVPVCLTLPAIYYNNASTVSPQILIFWSPLGSCDVGTGWVGWLVSKLSKCLPCMNETAERIQYKLHTPFEVQ